MSEESSNGKAEVYQRDMMGPLEACVPLVKMKRNSSDPPWINAVVRRKLRQRRAIYRKEGRSAKWKRPKKITEDIIRRRQANYLLSQKDVLLQKEGDRNFFKNVRNCRSKEKPAPFDVKTLFPGMTEGEVAEELAGHCNNISSEFSPLEAGDIPYTKDRELPMLEPFQVAGRLRAFRKPRSMVQGDIFPCLLYTSPSPRDS